MNALKIILTTVAFTTFILAVGLAGSLDHEVITLTEYVWKSLICVGIGGICVYVLNRIDD